MILLLKADASPASVQSLIDAVRALGLDLAPLGEGKGVAYEVIGGNPSRVLTLASEPAVAEILTRRTPLTGGEPVWPHFLLRLGSRFLVLVVLLALVAAFLPVGLSDPEGEGPRPPGRTGWFLRPLDGLFRLLPKSLHLPAGLCVAALILAMLAWPWIDRGPASTPAGRLRSRALRAAAAVVVLGLVALAFLP